MVGLAVGFALDWRRRRARRSPDAAEAVSAE
jgi:hypothetical protein